jgi:flagellar biogenesis protein FliO
MKKFFKYSLGVFSWLGCLTAQAADKFEVLPDLPEALTYAVQPVQAAAVSGNTGITSLGTQASIGQEPNIISVVLSLLFVILLIYITGIIYAKLNKIGFKTIKKQNVDFARSQVSVISTTQLGSNKTLHVVELDGKRMLIGASSSAIQLIKDLGNFNENNTDEEYSHIEIPNIKIPKIEIPKIEIPSINFSKLVTKAHKAIDELEEEDSENAISISEINSSSEEKVENSETIINSLFPQQDDNLITEEPVSEIKSEHTVDPDDYALYKKYLS